MKIIAIYARQSIDKKDSVSIESQIDKCKEQLSDEECKRLKIYTDKGYSGKNLKRPNIEKLIKDIKNRKVEKVVVYKLDRISRSITDFYKLYEIMNAYDCGFSSATEGIGTTNPTERTMMGILAVFAQTERENIQKRVKDNYYDRTERLGTWPGGPAPYGFVNSRTEDKRPTLIPNENEKEAVEFLFDSYANDLNVSLGMLAKKLFEKGYRSHKRKNGVFDNVTVARILKNTVYVKADNILYNYLSGSGIKIKSPIERWDGSHSAHVINKKPYNEAEKERKRTENDEQVAYLTNFSGFIDSITYIKVQKRLKENQQIRRANGSSKLEEFAGKLKCGKCGYAIKIYNGSLLSCYGNVSCHVCDAKFKKRGYFDCLLLKDVRDRVALEISSYYSYLRCAYNKKVDNREKLENEKKELDSKINNLVETLGEMGGKASRAAIIEKLENCYSQKNDIELKLADIATIDVEDYKKNISYHTLSLKQRKAIINKLIDRINIYDTSAETPYKEMPYKVEVIWKNEISEEQDELCEKMADQISNEDADKMLIETFCGMPYEEHERLQNEMMKMVEEFKKEHDRRKK